MRQCRFGMRITEFTHFELKYVIGLDTHTQVTDDNIRLPQGNRVKTPAKPLQPLHRPIIFDSLKQFIVTRVTLEADLPVPVENRVISFVISCLVGYNGAPE